MLYTGKCPKFEIALYLKFQDWAKFLVGEKWPTKNITD